VRLINVGHLPLYLAGGALMTYTIVLSVVQAGRQLGAGSSRLGVDSLPFGPDSFTSSSN
jgi:hypothetical protein